MQRDRLDVPKHGSRTQHENITMPTKAFDFGGNVNSVQIGFGMQLVCLKYRAAATKPIVGLLQHDNIGDHAVNHIQNTPRVTVTIPANCLADVVAGYVDAVGRAHKVKIGHYGCEKNQSCDPCCPMFKVQPLTWASRIAVGDQRNNQKSIATSYFCGHGLCILVGEWGKRLGLHGLSGDGHRRD